MAIADRRALNSAASASGKVPEIRDWPGVNRSGVIDTLRSAFTRSLRRRSASGAHAATMASTMAVKRAVDMGARAKMASARWASTVCISSASVIRSVRLSAMRKR
ncbi:hypothetical protein GTC6_23264, partial [Gordonia terrae C-6]